MIILKFIDDPTAIKNNPSNNPLNGSISLSSSCLYSLLARTTPPRKVPRAGLSPTEYINAVVPTTSSNAVAVNNSRRRVEATYLNKGTHKYPSREDHNGDGKQYSQGSCPTRKLVHPSRLRIVQCRPGRYAEKTKVAIGQEWE